MIKVVVIVGNVPNLSSISREEFVKRLEEIYERISILEDVGALGILKLIPSDLHAVGRLDFSGAAGSQDLDMELELLDLLIDRSEGFTEISIGESVIIDLS